MIVLRVAIQRELADGNERVLAVRPHFGEVKWVELALLGLFEGHDLDGHAPRRAVAALDRVVEVTLGVVGVGALQTRRLGRQQVLYALVSLTSHTTSRCVTAETAIEEMNCVYFVTCK